MFHTISQTTMVDIVDKKSLFVSNLDENVSDTLLYELFLQAGPIDNISISNAADNSLVGVVTYKHVPSVCYAKDIFRGTRLFERRLVLSTENLFDLAEMKAHEARQSSLRGQSTRRNDQGRSMEPMDPRHRWDMNRHNRHDRSYPYERHERRFDRPSDDRRRNRRGDEYYRHRRYQ